MENNNPLNEQKLQNEGMHQAIPGEEQPPKSHLSRSFNERLGEADLLAVAMQANQDALTPGGGGADFVNKLQGVLSEIRGINQEQERFKASLKSSTEKFKIKAKEMAQLVRKGRSIVKNELPQVRWVEFGIKATR
jgi:hypothetical protein